MPAIEVITKVKILLRVIKLEETISLTLSKIAPAVAGINKLKEKLKAAWGERPSKSAEKMVQPERETPGRMANAWKIPTIKAER